MTSSWREGDDRPVVVAIVAYQGVLADETDAFRDVLSLLPRARVFIAGAQPGIVAGPGGAHEVEATFEELDRADVVVVPGGLGSHRHPEIAAWLRRIKPRFVLASSTGSALLAASGLLKGRTAVTHWLAGPLLELHGVTVSKARLEVDEPYITCSGLATRVRRRLRRGRGDRRHDARATDPRRTEDDGRQATTRRSSGTTAATAAFAASAARTAARRAAAAAPRRRQASSRSNWRSASQAADRARPWHVTGDHPRRRPAGPWHHRCGGRLHIRLRVGQQRRARRRRDGAHPPDPP